MNTINPLPHGHVTILFTDVEDTTRINQRVGDAIYALELREPYLERLRSCISMNNGHIVGTPAGDMLMAVFQNPDDALACSCAIQNSLATPLSYTHDGVIYTIRSRIGVHTAQTQIHPKHADDYIGNEIKFAARVESLGRGEQILVHESVRKAARSWNRYQWQAWPSRLMRGYDNPETVYELLWDGSPLGGEPGMSWLQASMVEANHKDTGEYAEDLYADAFPILLRMSIGQSPSIWMFLTSSGFLVNSTSRTLSNSC